MTIVCITSDLALRVISRHFNFGYFKSTNWFCSERLLVATVLFLNTTSPSDRLGSDSGVYKEDIFAFLQYSVRVQDAATELGASAISDVDGCVVTVATEKPVSGAIYLTADQSRDDNSCHGKGCHPKKGYRMM